MEFSQTREDVQHSTESAFTKVRSQGKCCPRVPFDQDSHTKNLGQDPCSFFPENRDQPMQSGHYHISGQECPTQRARNQLEINAQIACKVQVEELAREQYQSFQTGKLVDTDCINHPDLVPHRLNRSDVINVQVIINLKEVQRTLQMTIS